MDKDKAVPLNNTINVTQVHSHRLLPAAFHSSPIPKVKSQGWYLNEDGVDRRFGLPKREKCEMRRTAKDCQRSRRQIYPATPATPA